MRKLRGLAMFLLLVFTLNFIPVQAYENGSKFGINSVWGGSLESGERYISIAFSSNIIEDIKEIKVYTKVVSHVFNEETMNYDEILVNGPTILVNEKDNSIFTGYLSEEQIKDFGFYQIDKIEIILKDGGKRVSYNSDYYTSISDNDRENGELVDYEDTILYEYVPLSISNPKFQFKVVKLGQDQNYTFKIESGRAGVEAKKVYVTFKKLDDNNKKQVVVAEKLEDGSYSAKLNLKNSLDTGTWKADSITVVDNYDRQYDLNNYEWNQFKVVSENADIEAPRLNSLELSSNVYDSNEGTPVIFTLDITDDLSGFDYGYIYLENGDLTDSVYIGKYDLKDGKYETGYRYFKEVGTWEISKIELRDLSKNTVVYVQNIDEYNNYYDDYEYIQMDFSDKKIEVVNIIEKPEVNIEILEMTNNSPEITNGEEIDLEIKLKTDINLSGWLNIEYMSKDYKYIYLNANRDYQYDENGNLIENEEGIYTFNIKGDYEYLKYLPTNLYECNYFSVGYIGEDGEYYDEKFVNTNIENISWNEDVTKLDLSNLNINCNNPNEDITPPEIVDISIDKSVVKPGETVEMKIKVEDDKSGPRDYSMSIGYDNLNYEDISISYDKESTTYTAKINIPSYATTGKYNISYLGVSDIAENHRFYSWDNEWDKDLLSKVTILVKSDLNEKLPPEITTNIEFDGETFKAPFTPIVNTDHGSLTILLDGQEYNGEAINKIGSHQLYIKATGVDGSVSTKLVSFKVIAEINNETKPEDIVDQITSSTDKEVIVEVSSDTKEVDKSIFEAIKGEDKTVSFKQEDGTVWSFNGKDIKDENLEGIENIKISVSNEPEEENKDSIESLDSGARVIHFDYHGVLPGKATVKIKVDNPEDLIGKDLTFYYFNPETQKAEKVQGPLSIDNEGYVTVEIEHCSDYFLSQDDSLHLDEPIITVEKEEIELVEGETKNINATVKPQNTKLEYISSDEKIVTVDENGLLTAKSEGEAKITIKALEVTKEITVKVKKKNNDEKPEVEPQEPEEEVKPQVPVVPSVPEEELKPQTPVVPEASVKPIIILERDEIQLTLGQSFNINAKVTPVDKTLEYISSNTNIIEVNKFGLITTKMPGEAIIVVKCEDVTREIKVTVKKNEEVTIEGDKVDTNTNNDVVEDNNSNNKNEENQNNLPTTGQVVSSLQLALAALMIIGVGTILFRRRKNIN